MGKHDLESHQLCTYLLVRDGMPACLFRVADVQPCGYFKGSRCYYRSGPFTAVKPVKGEELPSKENNNK